MPTETLDSAVAQLHANGYTDTCRAEEDGMHFRYGGAVYPVEQLSTDSVMRLEGTSAPGEQSVVFGLSSPDGQFKGTYCVAYGPDMDPLDADALQRLELETEPARRQEEREGLQPQF